MSGRDLLLIIIVETDDALVFRRLNHRKFICRLVHTILIVSLVIVFKNHVGLPGQTHRLFQLLILLLKISDGLLRVKEILDFIVQFVMPERLRLLQGKILLFFCLNLRTNGRQKVRFFELNILEDLLLLGQLEIIVVFINNFKFCRATIRRIFNHFLLHRFSIYKYILVFNLIII